MESKREALQKGIRLEIGSAEEGTGYLLEQLQEGDLELTAGEDINQIRIWMMVNGDNINIYAQVAADTLKIYVGSETNFEPNNAPRIIYQIQEKVVEAMASVPNITVHGEHRGGPEMATVAVIVNKER